MRYHSRMPTTSHSRRHRSIPDMQICAMRPWALCISALKGMDVDAVARAVGLTPRTVRNWRRSVRRYPRHSQARAVLACVHTWLDHDVDDPRWRTPGAFDWREYRQPWTQILGWLRGRGYSMVELGERLGSSRPHALTRRSGSECSFPFGEALLRVYWRARAGAYPPRRGWRECGPPPEGVMAPCVWDGTGPPGWNREGQPPLPSAVDLERMADMADSANPRAP